MDSPSDAVVNSERVILNHALNPVLNIVLNLFQYGYSIVSESQWERRDYVIY
jgi:hypothetical protein